MSGKSNYLQSGLLALIFNATTIANLAENASVSPLTSLYVALHTADPGNGGNQSTSELSYTGYARVAVARTSGGWVVSGTSPTVVQPAANITFPTSTGGTGGTVTNWSIGTAPSGAGNILYSGPVNPTVNVINGVTPQLTTSSNVSED